MKKFILDLFLFSILLISTLYVFEKITTNGLKRSHSSGFNATTKIFNGTINAELLITGSSKALVQVSPKILDSILNTNSYNIGMDGTPFTPQNARFNIYMQHNKVPKTIIQIVSNGTLSKRPELYEKIIYAPYLNNEEINTLTKKYDSFSFLDYNIPFVKYAGFPFIIINGITSFLNFNLNPDKKYKGYLEQDRNWDQSFSNFKINNREGVAIKLDNQTISLFEEYIIKCKQLGINLILVYPPSYYEAQLLLTNRKDIVNYYKELSSTYNVAFLDFSNDCLTSEKKYFYNSQHLNKNGAELFSTKLAIKIEPLIL